MENNLSIDNKEVKIASDQRNISAPSYFSNETNYGDERTSIDFKEDEIDNEELNYRMPIYRSSYAIEEEHDIQIDRVYRNATSAEFSLPVTNSANWDVCLSTDDRPSYDTVKLNVEDMQLDFERKYSKVPLSVSSNPKPKTMKKEALLPSVAPEFREKMQFLEIRVITIFHNKSNSIGMFIPPEIGDKEKDCIHYLRETVGMLNTEMEKLPNLTFLDNSKELKIMGSYCYNYGVCSFDAQMWKIDPSIAEGNNKNREYIFQFRRTSLHGRDAFEDLVRRIASLLLEWGRAKTYANGFNIYPYKTVSMELDGDSCDDILFDSPTETPIEISSESDTGITLDNDLICSWAKPISELLAYGEENIRILAMCAKNIDNCELMAEEPKLHEALCVELKHGKSPSSCANTLLILEAILKDHSLIAMDSFRKCGILDAVTRSLLSFNSYEPKLDLHSVAIERNALNILEMLIGNQEIRFTQTEMEMVLKKLEILGGKLKGQSRKCLNSVITQLKKRTKLSVGSPRDL